MIRLSVLALFFASLVQAAPLGFTGQGGISGVDGFFDLAGNGFEWHVSTDSTSFGGQICAFGASCDLGLLFVADSLSGVNSVYGKWGGRDWGTPPQHLLTESNTFASWSFPSNVTVGTRVSVPIAISGTIAGAGLELFFAGAGAQWVTVQSLDSAAAGVMFGAFQFAGTIGAASEPVPEPMTLGLGAAALLALAVLRRTTRAVP
ncbi:MAG TPA: hypothetical protein VF767_07780 [Bryobacteraceae bacterium]